MNDLRDLLHAAADELPTDGLRADALAGRVRRRRAARTVTRSAVGVGAVGALAFGAAQLQDPLRAAGSAAEAGAPTDSAVEVDAPTGPALDPQAGAAPGACGWAVAAGAQDDGSTITTSTLTGDVRATVVPADIATDGTLDVVVLLGSDDEDRARLTAESITLLVTQDGVVVAREDHGDHGPTSVAQQAPEYLSAGVPLEACERPDGAGPAGALDGDLAVWVLADLTRDGASARVLGGGTPVHVERGTVPDRCGDPLDELTSDRSAALAGTAEIGALADTGFVPGAEPLDALKAHLQLTVADGTSRAAGGLGGARLLLTDAAGTVVSDSAAPGGSETRSGDADDDPWISVDDRFGGWYDVPAVGQGAGVSTKAVACDGEPLPPGTYEAWGVLALAPWDPDLAAGPALGSLGTITVP